MAPIEAEPSWRDRRKRVAVAILILAQVATLSLWFTSSAILPDLAAEYALSTAWQALFAAAVQAGFVAGALASAVFGAADRFDPRRFFALSALAAAAANAGLLMAPPGGIIAIGLRAIVGAALAGVYPVGMKLATGWGRRDRGLLVGLLVGALTLGSASPHLVASLGGADWRWTVGLTSLLAAGGGLVILAVPLGPFHGVAAQFRLGIAAKAWTDRRLRLVNLGYLGHMWELYAMWAWIGVALTAGFATHMPANEAATAARLGAFAAIGVGALGCVAGGLAADRIGRAEVTILAMLGSGSCALLAAICLTAAPMLLLAIALVWGFTVIADSAQFSASVADLAPADEVGTLLTTQTCVGFALTFVTVQALPYAAAAWGWPATLALLAIGPYFGAVAMARLRRDLRGYAPKSMPDPLSR